MQKNTHAKHFHATLDRPAPIDPLGIDENIYFFTFCVCRFYMHTVACISIAPKCDLTTLFHIEFYIEDGSERLLFRF